jgi:hypothetical protein
MKSFRMATIIIVAGMLAAGCTGTIFKSFSIDDESAKSISMDARQRLVIVTDKGGPKGDRRVVCAEPSPDAFMALAASAGANVSIGGKEAGGYGTMAEAAGALGMRTQTIQLMRDTLYRSCEAYMNGLIDKQEYRKILSAFDELLITLVAIEGLGRPNIGPLPKIATEASHDEKDDKEKSTAKGSAATGTQNYTHVAISPDAAKSMYETVKNYYCFQLGMKEFFYSDKDENKKDDGNQEQAEKKNRPKRINKTVLNSLCGD